MIGRLITLKELMKSFAPQEYLRFQKVIEDLALVATSSTDAPFTKYFAQMDIDRVRQDCIARGWPCSRAGAERLLELARAQLFVGQGSLVLDQVRYLLQALTDEMAATKFLSLDAEEYLLAFEPSRFGTVVDTAFPSATWDIEEAGRCLAFDRWVAAVFHLGRVAELATVTIGKRVGYESPKDGFGEVLKYLDNNLRKAREDYTNARAEFKGDIEFLSALTAQMYAVKQAWRDKVAHMEKKYTEDEAMRVWDTTRILMQHLATKLSDEPTA